MTSPHNDGGPNAPDSDLPPPSMERGIRGAMSAAAMLECIVLLLALPVASVEQVGTVGTIVILALSASHLALCAFVRKPWFLPVVIVLQVLVIACWFFAAAIGIVGVVFAAAWASMIWMRDEVRRRWAAGTLPVQQPTPSDNGE